MPFKLIPEIETCCGVVPSLRTASAIIATLAIITNPLLSWLMLRHTYALRVSCNLSTASRVDIIDININNVVSFGFGVDADLGHSCLTRDAQSAESVYSKVVKGVGWAVLIVDLIHLIMSTIFLIKIFRNPSRRVAKAFMIIALIAVLFSTIYGILFVIVCAVRGQGIALCQLIFAMFDLGLWIYFLMVVHTYSRKIRNREEDRPSIHSTIL